MADKETGLNITVGAVADENSAKQAAKDLTKAVNSSVKGGRITVPVDINVPIDESKEKLTKAQKAVIDTLTKMTSKGFSASGKDVDDLTSKFNEFTHALDEAGKGRQNKIFREIRKQVEDVKQVYKAAQVDKKSTRVYDTKTKKTDKPKIKKEKGYIDTGAKVSKKEIDAAIKAEQKRRYKGTKSTGPAEYGSGWVDPSRTNKREAKLSEVSSYRSGFASQIRRSEKETSKDVKDSLTITKDKELANKLADEALAKGKRKQPTAIEKAGELSEVLRKNLLPDLLSKIKTSDDDAEISKLTEEFFDTLQTISRLNQDAGKLIFNDVKKDIGIAMGSVGFSTKGNIGGTDGDKEDTSRNPKIVPILKGLLDKVAEKEDAIKQELIKLEQLEKTSRSKTKVEKTIDNLASRMIAETRANKTAQMQNLKEVTQAVKKDERAVENQTAYDKVENAAERVADSTQETEQKATTEANKQEALVLEEDAKTGFNDANTAGQSLKGQADMKRILGGEVKGVLQNILTALSAFNSADKTSAVSGVKANLEDAMCPCQDILSQIAQGVKNIDVNVGNILQGLLSMGAKLPNNLPALIEGEGVKDIPVEKDRFVDKTDYDKLHTEKLNREVEKERNTAFVHNSVQKYRDEKHEKEKQEEDNKLKAQQLKSAQVPLSNIIASSFKSSAVLNSIRQAFGVGMTGPNASSIAKMNQAEIEKLRAERISRFGLTRDDKAGGTGDLGRAYRTKAVYGWDKNNKNPFADLKLSDSLNIDVTKITERLQDVIQKNQFNAQTGGVLRNIIGPMTGYIGQPSIEKSRAEAEGLNSVMAEIRQAAQKILQEISAKETDLRGMQQTGKAVFNQDGTMNTDLSTKEAVSLFGDLEEQKMALRGVLADATMVNQVVENTGGNVNQILKQLGFAAPELRKCNTILQNLNAGLDKSGKALKFQTRSAEVLNYAFQLMARSVGQTIKRWISMLNPINLIKRAFQDFASYDVKWQRTMNVIKYNLRRIIKPAIQGIAQQIVNIIGLVNALIKGIGKVFGQNWDLFDQAAANTEKMEEDFEKINNVTASFDELHDISGETGANDASMDLMGDIYTPQWEDAYKAIEDFGKKIGDAIKGIQKLTDGWDFWDWLKLAGEAWLGYKALKWLLGSLDGFGSLKSTLGGLGLGNLLADASILLGVLGNIKGILDFIDIKENWYSKNKDERYKDEDANVDWGSGVNGLLGAGLGFKYGIPGIASASGGIVSAGVGAGIGYGIGEAIYGGMNTAINWWKGDTEGTKRYAKDMGEGIGRAAGTWAGAKLGATIGTAIAPGVGTAIGTALGGIIGFVAGTEAGKSLGEGLGNDANWWSDFIWGKGSFEKMKVDTDDVTDAVANAKEKTSTWKTELEKLAQMEKVTGEKGKDLYDQIEQGKVSYWGLSDAQKAVYDQYIKVQDAQDAYKEATKTALESSAKYEEQLGKESGNFQKYIATIKDGVKEGMISHDDMLSYFAQTYATLDEEHRKVFLGQLPKYMRESVAEQSKEYMSGYDQLKEKIKNVFIDIGNGVHDFFAGASNELVDFTATEDDLTESTKLLNDAQERQTDLQNEIADLEVTTGQNAEELFNQVKDGTKAYDDLTQQEKLLIDKYADLQDAMKITDDCTKRNTDVLINLAYQAGKTEGDYSKFIDTVIQENEKGNLSTEEMEKKFSQAYAAMDADARKTFLEKIPQSMREGVEKGASEYMTGMEGFVARLWKKLGELWDGIKKFGENVWGVVQSAGNWLSGKGFKTDIQIRQEEEEYKRKINFASFAIGTNYIPSDGLAYLHKGEAVIPAKYNRPYQPTDNLRIEGALNRLSQQVEHISTKVDQGIAVKGQFVQRGNDLVASVERTNNILSNSILSNKVYAR